MKISKTGPEAPRLEVLDGFRAIAILLVIFYHYLYRFRSVPGLYPYGEKYADNIIISHGYLGVPLFFMISGFVIYLTLEKCRSFGIFMLRRLIRLFPLLLSCSLVTFFIVPALMDTASQKHSLTPTDLISAGSWKDFLPSLTFTTPSTWSRLFGTEFSYIDGVYWSLTAEMKYYIFAGLLFFYNKKQFIRNWLLFTAVVLSAYYLLGFQAAFYRPAAVFQSFVLQNIFLAEYLVYFTLGMLFFLLYKKRKIKLFHLFIAAIYVIVQALAFLSVTEAVFFIFFIGIFSLYIYKPTILKPLFPKLIAQIGLVSYPLYLIHQNIGILSIHNLSHAIQDNNGLFSMFLVSITMILFSFLIHYKIDMPVQKKLKDWAASLMVSRKKAVAEEMPASIEKDEYFNPLPLSLQADAVSVTEGRENGFNHAKEKGTALKKQ